METQSHKITVEVLQEQDMEWFVETAATRMLIEELKKPELVNTENLYVLATMGALSGTAWVAKKEGIPVGALGALVIPNVYNPEIQNLAEMFWFVLPEYRKTRAGVMLFNTYSDKAEELQLEATMSLLPSSNVNFKAMNKRGFELGEYGFRKEK